MNEAKEAIRRILDRIDRWKLGYAGKEKQDFAYMAEKWLIDPDFRKQGGKTDETQM